MTNASWLPRLDGPCIDVDRGIFWRRGAAEKETDKRRPPSSRDGGDYLGMSEEVFEHTYYHNSPDYQDGIGDAFGAAKAKAREIARRKKK